LCNLHLWESLDEELYQTKKHFIDFGKERIEPAILARRGAKIRNRIIRAIRRGKRKWKKFVGYGRRWLVEGFFSNFKRWFGEYVSSVKFENIRKELVLKVAVTNMFLAMNSG